MTTTLRTLTLAAGFCVLTALTAGAQTNQASSTTSDNTRPATTTFYGDTGLWFVPTAEVLPEGKYSVSGYRRGTNYIQGYTNVGDFAGTFAYGIKGRAEIFGSILFDTRIDRDVRPLFCHRPDVRRVRRSIPARCTRAGPATTSATSTWAPRSTSGPRSNQKPAAVAVKFMVKLPTANSDNGIGTGKADFLVDFIASKEAEPQGGSLRIRRLRVPRQHRRLRPSGRRVSIRRGRRVSRRAAASPDDGTERHRQLERHRDATRAARSRPRPTARVPPFTVNTENITRATIGVDLPGAQGILPRRAA